MKSLSMFGFYKQRREDAIGWGTAATKVRMDRLEGADDV